MKRMGLVLPQQRPNRKRRVREVIARGEGAHGDGVVARDWLRGCGLNMGLTGHGPNPSFTPQFHYG
jgi:hypothetical protein